MVAALTLALAACGVVSAFWWTTSESALLSRGWFAWNKDTSREADLAMQMREDEAQVASVRPPVITFDMIQELTEWDDKQKALIQAQVWLQMLKDHGMADSRVERLEQIITSLEELLRPQPEQPPAFIKEFRQALQGARDAIAAEDLRAAGRELAVAEDLLNEHPDELSAFGRSYLAIKHRYEQLRLRLEGHIRIEELLVLAEQNLREERPTAASEAIAQALFYALGTPLEEAEFAERQRTVQRLRRELRYAIGKRAVEDAQRCHDKNDGDARNEQLAVALDVLPDLPSDRVESLLNTARELAGEVIENPIASQLGRELAFRASYEGMLEYYGQRDGLLELAARCVTAMELLKRAPHLGDEPADKIERVILSAMEFAMFDLLSLPPNSDEAPRGMAMVKEALEVASIWQDRPQYRAVRKALISKEDEVAGNAIRMAIQRAHDGTPASLRSAIELIEPALHMGTEASRAKASEYQGRWQTEYDRLTYVEARKEAWDELVGLSRAGRYVDAWIGLNEFESRFSDSSDSPYHANIPSIRQRLRPLVDESVAQLTKEMQDFYSIENWPRFRAAGELLVLAPLNSDQQRLATWIVQELERLDEEAEAQFEKAKTHRRMINDTEVIRFINALDLVLYLDPHHKEAETQLEKARERASSLAQGFLLRARKVGPRNRAIYQKYLERAAALDPSGKFGIEAKQLLEEL